MASLLLLLPWGLLSCSLAYDRPIIGIVTEPLGVEMVVGNKTADLSTEKNYTTYIAASYVKFAEMAGARVVPLHYDAPEAELRSLFGKINGILFPGGGTDIFKGKFREAEELLFNLAVKANDDGDVFPIHATCLGFQMLAVLAAKNNSVMCNGCFDSDGDPLPLNFTTGARSSNLFKGMSDALFAATATENLTENSHSSGVRPETFVENKNLAKFFNVLSTNVDYKGKEFVSTIEANAYPITASQWHPEKNNFEWGSVGRLGKTAIPHGPNAIALSQHFANHLVNNARLNSHRFMPESSEAPFLITNNPPQADPNHYFEQVYIWHRSPSAPEKPVIV